VVVAVEWSSPKVEEGRSGVATSAEAEYVSESDDNILLLLFRAPVALSAFRKFLTGLGRVSQKL
jgi:hypothetical protein